MKVRNSYELGPFMASRKVAITTWRHDQSLGLAVREASGIEVRRNIKVIGTRYQSSIGYVLAQSYQQRHVPFLFPTRPRVCVKNERQEELRRSCHAALRCDVMMCCLPVSCKNFNK